MQLKSISIKKFQSIKETAILDIPADNQWIFMTGENGKGKTNLLQAIALGVMGYENHTFSFSKKRGIEIITTLHHSVTTEPIKLTNKTEPLIPIVAYGSSRQDIAPYDNDEEALNSPTYSLFRTRGYLKNIELELAKWYLKREISNEFKEKYENVIMVLKKLLPNIAEITIDINNKDKVKYTEKDENDKTYPPVYFSQLASGFKSIISIVGDMIIRFFEQTETNKPAEFEGIVIIDELDLHLHPNLQMQLPTLLSEIFPHIQFIVSTHSPIPLLGAVPNSVFINVTRNAKEGTIISNLDHIDIFNLTPNTILSSPLFGFNTIYPKNHNPQERIHTEDLYDEVKLNDFLRKRLEKFVNS
jgi:predicted ATP-binding protein involved in virulence